MLYRQQARRDVPGAHRLAQDVVRTSSQGDMPEAVVLVAGQYEYAAVARFGKASNHFTHSHVGQVRGQQHGVRRPLCLKLQASLGGGYRQDRPPMPSQPAR